jgi:alkaline phosphatase D
MTAGHAMAGALSRRAFVVGGLAAGAALAARGAVAPVSAAASPALGPILGHMEPTRATIWFRPADAGEYRLEVEPAAGGAARTFPERALEENDRCIHWRVDGLSPATPYRYRIVFSGGRIADPGQTFTTPPTAETPARVRLAIGSCAREDAGSRAVWQRIGADGADAVVLLGDTPYIDSTDLAVQTRRHREFAAVPEYQALLRSRPCWWTWDDHDFGGGNATGLLPGKENSRLAYTRYRPQSGYGDGRNGIYTSFRFGPVEMFLLDTRWFAATEPSFANPGFPTLLGAAQWEWLQRGLRASTAPFKLLACGMIWDDKEVKTSFNDSWGGPFLHERRALEKFILTHRIPGVVLVGGDIHVSRVLRYKSEATVGYNLVQFISSPIHGGVIPTWNVYNPAVVRSAAEPNVFLMLEADSTVAPARLEGTLINAKGERVFSYGLTAAELSPAPARSG